MWGHIQDAVAPLDAVAALWSDAGLPRSWLPALQLPQAKPALPSSFAVTTAAQVSIGAAALAAAVLWHQRSGERQRVTVDGLHAAIAFRSERHLKVAGAAPAELWDPISGLYPCADGWVRLHANFAHHRDGLLRLLACAHAREAVAGALKQWPAQRLEDEATERGLVAAAVRKPQQWQSHDQAEALRTQPLVSIERIGDAPVEAMPEAVKARAPLAGIRVLELTRIIAGPVCGRTLAAHGADVLHVSAAHLPSIDALTPDTGRGKRSCFIDLRYAAGVTRMNRLLAAPNHGADVLMQSYRPGCLAALGFGAEACAKRRPGIVVASLSAYGHRGPWAHKRGFDSLVQSVTGMNMAEAEAAAQVQPRGLPAQVLDHASGYLLAFGVMVALHRRAIAGGSWHVRVSLARTAQWLTHLGRLTDGFNIAEPTAAQVAAYTEAVDSDFGTLQAIRYPAQMSATPPRFGPPSVRLGAHAATW